MKMIVPKDIFLRESTSEELLPENEGGFPLQTLKVDFSDYNRAIVPWHWHKAFEIFYVREGYLEYRTPNHVIVFPPGSGGIVNTNILHGTQSIEGKPKSVQYVHQLLPTILSGREGSRIDVMYFKPYMGEDRFEILGFFPDVEEHKEILEMMRRSFQMDDDAPGFELRARADLSELWLKMISQIPEQKTDSQQVSNDTLRIVMRYVYQHYHEKIYVKNLADAAFISERECYRLFSEHLNVSPAEYIQTFRIQAACELLVNSKEPVTRIGQLCGLGSSSYFGKIFREKMGCTPAEYRKNNK